MVAATPSGHPATPPYKPAVVRFAPRPANYATHAKRAARRAVFRGHAQRLYAVQLAVVRRQRFDAAQPPFCPAD